MTKFEILPPGRLVLFFLGALLAPLAAEPFAGTPTSWHEGFARYDFVMDDATLEILPMEVPADEKFGIGKPAKGKHRCVVIVPERPAPGNPWSWRGCYWDHQPQTEIELLRRGFHIAYISAGAELRPGREWDAWYGFLTTRHGLSAKPAFIGMSRGGEFAYTWAGAHPEWVSCVYADNPGGNPEMLTGIAALAARDVPLFHVCGSIDPLLGRFSNVIEASCLQSGGRISVVIKDGTGHHPHSLRDPRMIADFIESSAQPRAIATPSFVTGQSTRMNHYSPENHYLDSPEEGTSLTCRGPRFTGCYDWYSFELPGVDGGLNVIVPNSPAPGMPWVFRVGFSDRDAAVDLALLAKGFHIVTGPVSYNKDGVDLEDWGRVHQHFIAHGFSKKPVLEGAGRAAGDAYAWAIANPDKVSCIYGENPVLRASTPPDDLAVLAQVGVPLIHVCGSEDSALESQTRVIEKRYRELGGNITVILNEGTGHYPLAPARPAQVVGLITAATGN